MAVGAHQSIRAGHAIAHLHHLCQVFQVHLVHDPRRRRHHAEILKRLLPPLEKLKALAIALEFLFRVVEQGVRIAEIIHLHAVIDHQIDGNEGIDALRPAARPLHRRAHRGQIDQARHAGEILQNHSRRLERNLARMAQARLPGRQALHIFLAHLGVVAMAQAAFQENLDGKRQAVDLAEIQLRQPAQAKHRRLAPAKGELRFSAEEVLGSCGHRLTGCGMICARWGRTNHRAATDDGAWATASTTIRASPGNASR